MEGTKTMTLGTHMRALGLKACPTVKVRKPSKTETAMREKLCMERSSGWEPTDFKMVKYTKGAFTIIKATAREK